MTSISFPRQALPVGSEDSFYLDPFAVACLSPSAQLREMLLPYQRSAVAAVDSFLSDSGASFLTIGADVLEKAKAMCRAVPCDTNDALHLASALKGKCSYAITKDADWVWIPDAFRPAVVRVA